MIYFKFPFNEKLYTIEANDDALCLSFVSFDGKKQVNFKGKITEISEEDLENFYCSELPFSEAIPDEETQEHYLKKIQQVIDFIKVNQLKKLVISRQKIIKNTENINLTQSFLNLCKAYPNAFTYFFVNNEECWLGAFSEVLGKFNKKTSEFETMSLAGTLPINDAWTNKELYEQQAVTDYIKNIISKFSVDDKLEISETKDHFSGKIKHLRTDFKTKINCKNLGQLIAKLHPTPAVCGIPKEFCKEAIFSFEKQDRELYSGYIHIENEEFIQYFVNLRCGKFNKNFAKIFVGGGITAESSPQKEWQETNLKSEAILGNLANY